MRRLLPVAACAALAAGIVLAGGAARAQVPVKLGVLNDRSGVYADITGEGSVVAARMAVEDFGATQKGLKVEIVAADHQNKPDVGSNIARQWFDQDGVDVILDVPTSSVGLAISQIARDKNRVFLNSGSGTSDLTGKACSPNTISWTYDTWALGNGTGSAMTRTGGDTWFFVTADYAFGTALERDATEAIRKAGGKVIGSVRHPFPGQDFSSFVLQAQASKAKVVGFANAGGDTINAIKQASELGLVQGGQSLAGLLIFITDIKSLGLQTAQGLVLTEPFYWDQDERSRAFSKRFADRNGGKPPSAVQAGVYSSVIHYLKAVEALKATKDGAAVVAKMKDMPTDDVVLGKGSVRPDGRKLHDMHLFRVKKPAESKGPWDLYTTIATIPAAEAFRPMAEGGCPLVAGKG